MQTAFLSVHWKVVQSHVASGNDLVTEIHGNKSVQGHLDWHTNPHPRLGARAQFPQRLVIKPTPTPPPPLPPIPAHPYLLLYSPFQFWVVVCPFAGSKGWRSGESAPPPTNVARVQILASTPYVGWTCCWFSPLRGFSSATLVFPSPQKPTFPNSNSTRNQVDEEPLRGCDTSNHYYLFILLLKQSRILNLTENLEWALENADMLTTT